MDDCQQMYTYTNELEAGGLKEKKKKRKSSTAVFINAVSEITPLEAVKAAQRSLSVHVCIPHW